MSFNIALNYSGRCEIVDACRSIVADWAAGKRADIDEETIGRYLYTSGQPDPDLMIRTSGELRVSNFLLWQIAYAEIWVTQTLWPDFRRRDLYEAILDYQRRERRYGGVRSPRRRTSSPPAGSRAEASPTTARHATTPDRRRRTCRSSWRRSSCCRAVVLRPHGRGRRLGGLRVRGDLPPAAPQAPLRLLLRPRAAAPPRASATPCRRHGPGTLRLPSAGRRAAALGRSRHADPAQPHAARGGAPGARHPRLRHPLLRAAHRLPPPDAAASTPGWSSCCSPSSGWATPRPTTSARGSAATSWRR